MPVQAPVAPASDARSKTSLAYLFGQPASATRQEVAVAADPATVFEAIREADLGDARLVRAAVALRTIPDRILRRLRSTPPAPPPQRTIGGLIESGWWLVIADDPPERLTLGVVIWDRRVAQGGQRREYFDRPANGAVRVGWELRVEPGPGSGSTLVTETRTEPIGPRGKRRFRAYWTVISPFAAATRRLVINHIGREAETRVRLRT